MDYQPFCPCWAKSLTLPAKMVHLLIIIVPLIPTDNPETVDVVVKG